MVDQIGSGRAPKLQWTAASPKAPAANSAAASEGPRVQAGRPSPAPSGTVEAAGQLPFIARNLPSTPPVDTARVEALASQIANGSYKVDADRIADAMIRLETGRSARA